MRFFVDSQVAIVYHDDNEGCIPDAHLDINSFNLVTDGEALRTDNPFELNRAFQNTARTRRLSSLSNVMKHDSQTPTCSRASPLLDRLGNTSI